MAARVRGARSRCCTRCGDRRPPHGGRRRSARSISLVDRALPDQRAVRRRTGAARSSSRSGSVSTRSATRSASSAGRPANDGAPRLASALGNAAVVLLLIARGRLGADVDRSPSPARSGSSASPGTSWPRRSTTRPRPTRPSSTSSACRTRPRPSRWPPRSKRSRARARADRPRLDDGVHRDAVRDSHRPDAHRPDDPRPHLARGGRARRHGDRDADHAARDQPAVPALARADSLDRAAALALAPPAGATPARGLDCTAGGRLASVEDEVRDADARRPLLRARRRSARGFRPGCRLRPSSPPPSRSGA